MGAIPDPLDVLEREIRDLVPQRSAEQGLALDEVLEILNRVRREREEILDYSQRQPPRTIFSPRREEGR